MTVLGVIIGGTIGGPIGALAGLGITIKLYWEKLKYRLSRKH